MIERQNDKKPILFIYHEHMVKQNYFCRRIMTNLIVAKRDNLKTI